MNQITCRVEGKVPALLLACYHRRLRSASRFQNAKNCHACMYVCMYIKYTILICVCIVVYSVAPLPRTSGQITLSEIRLQCSKNERLQRLSCGNTRYVLQLWGNPPLQTRSRNSCLMIFNPVLRRCGESIGYKPSEFKHGKSLCSYYPSTFEEICCSIYCWRCRECETHSRVILSYASK